MFSSMDSSTIFCMMINEDDEECTRGIGDVEDVKQIEAKNCRDVPLSYFDFEATFSNETELQELPCIFPFYLDGVRIDETCVQFNLGGLNYPVFTCPVRNITTKHPGTNINCYITTNLTSLLDIFNGYFPDPDIVNQGDLLPPLNPELTNCALHQIRKPFSQCKNNCPGGKYHYKIF